MIMKDNTNLSMEAEQSKFKFQDTTATKKIFELRKKIRAVAGGTSASKTISILIWCIDYAQNKKHANELISIVSQSFPHLALGAIRDFQAIMKDRGCWQESNWHDTQHTYTFETGAKIEFFSSDAEKAHGPRRDVLFLNEAQNMPFNEADQLIVRTRKIVWMDWNPSVEFWFYTDLLGKRDDIDFITLTYKDNEALDEEQVREIESRKDRKGWWQVYGLGQLGEIEGIIYKGWQSIKEIPFGARLERYGIDFGYSNDPTAIVAIYYFNGGYILDEIAFQKGLSGKQIADILLNQPKKALCIGDSADPRLIDEIRSYGVNIQPAVKGQDSVRQGIQAIQELQISVTERSVNVWKASKNYMWATDRNGVFLSPNEPDHLFSDCCDAVRYGLTSVIPLRQREEFLANMPHFADDKKRVNTAR